MDIVTAEIVREYMETVAAEISLTLERSAVSPIVNEAHDCSAGVFYYDDKEVSLIARALTMLPHIYASVSSVQAILEFFKNDLHDGDVLLACDPYFGGSHIPDYTVMKPVFYHNKPVFFPAVRAHMLEVGGPVAGGYNSDAREVWQEGFRIAPIKLYEKGERRRDVWDLIKANNRTPEIMEHELNAMIGSCKVGEDRIRSLVDRYGFETVLQCVQHNLDYSERRLRSEIAKWPDGVYEGESILDQDFAGTKDVKVKVSITVKGDELLVDFTGSHPQTPGFVNSRPGNTLSYVLVALTTVFPDIPINSGLFRPVSVRLPERSVVNSAEPAPVGNSTVCIGCDIGQATLKALEKIVPERVGTECIDLVILTTIGMDARYSQLFISIDYQASPVCSGGAYGTDGWGGWPAGFTSLRITTIEMSEIQYPFVYYQSEYASDTAAPGLWRGAPAWWMKRQNVDPAICHAFVQGSMHPLQGYAGGKPGVGNYVVLHQGTSQEKLVRDLAFGEYVPPGDMVFAQSGGGGGWGDPLERDPQMVLSDVLNEYVSLGGAKRDYGVIIDPANFRVDEKATASLRRERLMKAKSP